MDQQGRESKANEAQLGQFILRVFMSMWSMHGSLEPGCAKLPKDSRKRGEAVDMEGISRLLRGLPPMQGVSNLPVTANSAVWRQGLRYYPTAVVIGSI